VIYRVNASLLLNQAASCDSQGGIWRYNEYAASVRRCSVLTSLFPAAATAT
jgi:hypothetical protein